MEIAKMFMTFISYDLKIFPIESLKNESRDLKILVSEMQTC